MAEEQKEKDDKPKSFIDGIFKGAADFLDNTAAGKSWFNKLTSTVSFGTIKIAGDEKIKKTVDDLGIDKFIGRGLALPAQGFFGALGGIRYVGTRIGSDMAYRRRFAAEAYKKGKGPWMGKIYGNADNIIKKDPKYAELYTQERNALKERDDIYQSLIEALDSEEEIELAATPVVWANVTRIRTDKRDTRARMKNPALSIGIAPRPIGAPPRIADQLLNQLDAINVKMAEPATPPIPPATVGSPGGITTQLDAERSAYLTPVPVLRTWQRRRFEKASRHVEWKKQLADSITTSPFGSQRLPDIYKKIDELITQIEADEAIPIASRKPDDIKRLTDNKKALQTERNRISGEDRVISVLFGAGAA